MKEQPLFKEINAAIYGIFYNIKAKVRPLEEYEILIAIVNALITHLKNFRKKRVTYRYNTPQEEADFLRKQTKQLLLYWLPDSLRNSNHIVVFLNEIVSINVLRPSINDLADSTFINQSIVKTLGNEELLEKYRFESCNTNIKPDECPVTDVPQPVAHNSEDSYTDLHASDSITSRKLKGKKETILRKVKGMVKLSPSKKPEKRPVFRTLSRTQIEDTIDVCTNLAYMVTDGCTDTMLREERKNSDLVISVSNTALQKWIQENWTAKINESPAQDQHTYKICVYKEDSLGTKLWMTERHVKDFRQIYTIIRREFQDLKIIPTLKDIKEADIDEDNQFFQAIGINPDTFVDILLELLKFYQSSEAFLFFSPFNYKEEERELLNTFFDDDDGDVSAGESKVEEEKDEESIDDQNGFYESDGFGWIQQKFKIPNKKFKDGSGSSEDHVPPMVEKQENTTFGGKKTISRGKQSDTAKSGTESFSVPTDEPSVKVNKPKSKPLLRIEEEISTQRKKLEDTFLDALYHLFDEFLAGGKSIFIFLHRTGILKQKSRDILAAIPKLYAEKKIVQYLNQTSEFLLTEEGPFPVPPHKLLSEAQGILMSKLKSLLTNYFVKCLFERQILKNITASHEAFQNTSMNKDTLFRILEDLTKIITN
ncbi:uncharacterized protein [Pyxicephalus adspersus]